MSYTSDLASSVDLNKFKSSTLFKRKKAPFSRYSESVECTNHYNRVRKQPFYKIVLKEDQVSGELYQLSITNGSNNMNNINQVSSKSKLQNNKEVHFHLATTSGSDNEINADNNINLASKQPLSPPINIPQLKPITSFTTSTTTTSTTRMTFL